MSIFNQKSKFKVKTEVRKVIQAVEPAPKKTASKPVTKPTSVASLSSLPASTNNTPRPLSKPSNVPASSSATTTKPVKRLHSSSSPESAVPKSQKRKVAIASANGRKSRSPAAVKQSPAFSDSDSDSEEDDWRDRLDPTRRRKRARTETEDPDRRLRHPALWLGNAEAAEEEQDEMKFIHAVEVASLQDKCVPVMGLERYEVDVELRYPGANVLEKYQLVWGKDKIDAAADIMKVVELVATCYLTDEQAQPFLDPNNGIYRRLEKSKNTNDGNGFKAALEDYNKRVLALQKAGVFAKNIDSMRFVPRELVAFILDQVYDRTVAPKVELLAKYENGSDNVYGELLHPFISDIFDRTRLTSDMVFVDLGSGVGNVTLQAALERGCESWGCEMMENACNLADAQEKEFLVRCRLWGLAPGKVRLERGDFRKNEATLEALKRADVVLVNNQAFTSQLNDHLVNMFLDLKVGCKIVSLKTFVHDNKIAENDVASTILEVEHLTYPEGYVSWTAAPGTFCISTRK